ncbi:hypothetical protein YC2023_077663 [Brassica napus]
MINNWYNLINSQVLGIQSYSEGRRKKLSICELSTEAAEVVTVEKPLESEEIDREAEKHQDQELQDHDKPNADFRKNLQEKELFYAGLSNSTRKWSGRTGTRNIKIKFFPKYINKLW